MKKEYFLKNVILFIFTIITTHGFGQVTESFDTWTDGSYGTISSFGEWESNKGLTESSEARSGKCVRLRNQSDSYLEYIGSDGNGKDGGVGVISFWYRSWDASPAAVYNIQVSIDGAAYTTIGSQINTTSTTYSKWTYALESASDNIKIKVIYVSGERLKIDDFEITNLTSTDPTVAFDTATSSQNETDATFNTNIPVTVSNYNGNQIDITVSATGGTAEATDYTLNTTTLTFNANGTQNISLDIKDDTDTDDETIVLTIAEGGGTAVTDLLISQATHTISIVDDEIPPVPTAGTVFITEVSNDKGGDFNSEYLELFNNSNETVSLATSKLIRVKASDNSSEYVFDFGSDENTTNTDLTIPAYGFIIISRGATKAEFDTDQGATLPMTVSYNGGNSNLFFGTTTRRWRLRTGGTANTDDGTIIDDTGAAFSGSRDYQNIFTNTFISDSNANGTPGTLEYLVFAGTAWINSIAIDETTAAKDAYIFDDITLSSNSEIKNFGITSGKTVTMNTTASIKVAGNLTTNDGLILNLGSSLIVNGTSTGNVTYKRTLTTPTSTGTSAIDNIEGWHLMSSPVAGSNFDDAWISYNSIASGTGNNRGIATYNNAVASNNWLYTVAPVASTPFGEGTGYSIKRSATGTVSFTGTVRTTDVNDISLTKNINGFNLVGNIFTSYISLNDLFTANDTGTNDLLASSTIWIWNSSTKSYDTKIVADNFQIAPSQGFFVEASAAASTFTINKSMLSPQTDTFLKSLKTEVQLNIADESSAKYAKIYYLENATTNFDNGFDGKLFSGIQQPFAVYTHLVSGNEGENYQIQSLPNTDFESMVIPIGVNAVSGKEITFTAKALNLPNDIKVFLEDRLTNTFTQLDEPNSEYKLTLTEKLDGVGRFYLHTTQNVLSTKDEILNSIEIYKTSPSILKIVGLPNGKTSLSLFNILGKEMISTSFISNGNKEISLSKLTSGVYIVKVKTEKGAIHKKIILE